MKGAAPNVIRFRLRVVFRNLSIPIGGYNLVAEPLVGARNAAIATAAISVFGQDSPYFHDEDVRFWFVGIGKGHLPGLGARTRPASPVAEVGAKDLLRVADEGKTAGGAGVASRGVNV